MNRFDFSYDEYQRFLERCPFTDDEKIIIEMRRKEKSVAYIALTLNVSERTVGRKIKSICKKILKEIK
nr:MAG TPA: ECF sigma factor [Caudoviricetes sp.]